MKINEMIKNYQSEKFIDDSFNNKIIEPTGREVSISKYFVLSILCCLPLRYLAGPLGLERYAFLGTVSLCFLILSRHLKRVW